MSNIEVIDKLTTKIKKNSEPTFAETELTTRESITELMIRGEYDEKPDIYTAFKNFKLTHNRFQTRAFPAGGG